MDNKDQENTKTTFQKAVHGGRVVFLGNFFKQILSAVQLIVLARLLLPRDFGLMGIALLTLSLLNVFTSPGLIRGLIQRDKIDKKDLNAIWTFGILRGFFLAVVLFFMAPTIAIFFDNQGFFKSSDFANPEQFIIRLQNTEQQHIDTIVSGFSIETQQFISNHKVGQDIPNDFLVTLIDELNTLVSEPAFHEREAFCPYLDNQAAQSFLQDISGNTTKINRFLFEEIFSNELRKVIFDTKEIVWILRTLSLTFILSAMNNIGTLFFRRELEFEKQLYWELISAVVKIICVVTLAFILGSVWALVWGQLIFSFVTAIVSYTIHSYRPKLFFDFSRIKKFWSFGKHIFFMSIFKFCILEGDDIFVGKVLGPMALGFYRYAYKISNMVATQINDVMSQVTFPAFSRIQDDLVKVRAGFMKSFQLVSLIAYPITFGLFILADIFTRVILGEKWVPIVPTMQVLCFMGLSKCLQVGTVFQAIGRPDISFKTSVFRFLFIVLSIYPLTMRYGLLGAALSVTVSTFIVMPYSIYQAKRLIKYHFYDHMLIIIPPLICSLVMAASLYFLQTAIQEITIVSFSFLVLTGILIYVISLLICQSFFRNLNVIALLKELISLKK